MAVTLSRRESRVPLWARRRRAALMEKFVIDGGVPLSGTMVPAGNKNGALATLAACMLTDEEVVVRNIPRIRDVEAMLRILASLGAEVSWRGPNEVASRPLVNMSFAFISVSSAGLGITLSFTARSWIQVNASTASGLRLSWSSTQGNDPSPSAMSAGSPGPSMYSSRGLTRWSTMPMIFFSRSRFGRIDDR